MLSFVWEAAWLRETSPPASGFHLWPFGEHERCCSFNSLLTPSSLTALWIGSVLGDAEGLQPPRVLCSPCGYGPAVLVPSCPIEQRDGCIARCLQWWHSHQPVGTVPSPACWGLKPCGVTNGVWGHGGPASHSQGGGRAGCGGGAKTNPFIFILLLIHLGCAEPNGNQM